MMNWKLCYLVKWEGFGVEHNSWEPWDNIHAPELVVDFHQRHPAAPHHIRTAVFNSCPSSPRMPLPWRGGRYQGTPYFTSTLSTPSTSTPILPSTHFPIFLCIIDPFDNFPTTQLQHLCTPSAHSNFTTYPLLFHLFTFSHLFLCRYISIMTLPPPPLLWLSPFSLVIWTYLSYSHIMPFNYLILFHFYLLFLLTPYLVLKPIHLAEVPYPFLLGPPARWVGYLIFT